MSEVEKLVGRLTKWSHVVGRDDIAAILREAASTLQSQARRVEELEGALREAADVARMTAYHIEKTKRPTNGHRAMWIASLAPIARSVLQSREAHPPSGVTAPDGEVGGGAEGGATRAEYALIVAILAALGWVAYEAVSGGFWP